MRRIGTDTPGAAPAPAANPGASTQTSIEDGLVERYLDTIARAPKPAAAQPPAQLVGRVLPKIEAQSWSGREPAPGGAVPRAAGTVAVRAWAGAGVHRAFARNVYRPLLEFGRSFMTHAGA